MNGSPQNLINKLEKIRALYLRATTEGERQAAGAALNRVQSKLDSFRAFNKTAPTKYEFIVFKSV